MFVDRVRVQAKAGDGGNGCVSFRREKFVPKGGPDGGNGGHGGDIILRADANVDNLATFHFDPNLRGKKGENGTGKNCYGRAAADSIFKVPIGTLIYKMQEHDGLTGTEIPGGIQFFDLETEAPDEAKAAPQRITRPEKELEMIADLAEEGTEFVLCKGGAGGKGNTHFKSARNRVPRECTPGQLGESGLFFLELRKIADAGLVGFPNAGKSTLLGDISAAHPKVAAYPFTTLHPIVGVVEFPGFLRATVADIPGLIEGAHHNAGLGHEFLRHIVRCKLLIHVVDMAGSEGRDPISDLQTIRKELKLYDPQLAERPWIIVGNKIDLEGAKENVPRCKRKFRKIPVYPISAQSGEGLDKLKEALRGFFAEHNALRESPVRP